MVRSLLLAALMLSACADPAPGDRATEAPALPSSARASAPTVAVTDDGSVLAWVDASDALKRLVVQPASGAPVTVAEGDIGSHSQAGPQLVRAGGALVLAYVVNQAVEGRRFPASELRVARSADGGRTWSAGVRPHPAPPLPTGHTFHSLAATDDGRVVLAWLDGTAKDLARAAERADAAPPARFVQHGAHAESGPPDGADALGAHDAGTHGAMPHADGEVGTELLAATSADGGATWSAPTRIAAGTCECCRTSLAVRGDTVVAVWRHLFPGGERDMAIARSADGGATWTAPARVWADGWALDGCPHAGPAVALAGDGAVHVAWPTGAPGRAGLWHAVSTDGGATFAAPTALAVPAVGLGQVRAATDASGRAWLAFEDGDGVRLLAAGSADTLRVDGEAAALAAAAGPTLVWDDGARIRVRAGS